MGAEKNMNEHILCGYHSRLEGQVAVEKGTSGKGKMMAP